MNDYSGLNQRGFTLMELLVSMTIIGAVVVMAAEALWLGQNAMDSASVSVDRELRLRTAINLISRQVRSVFPYYVKDDEGERPLFAGNRRSISFVTALPVATVKTGGLFRVDYFIEEDPATGTKTITAGQMPVYVGKEATGVNEIQERISVLPGLREAGWSFLHEGEWIDEWDAEYGAYPQSVRLTLRTDSGSDAYETVIPLFTAGAYAEGS